jgi:hypothetical protein
MNKKLITINGLRRSGNHCLANWIVAHQDTATYINDCGRGLRLDSNWLPAFSKYCLLKRLDDNPSTVLIGFENKINIWAVNNMPNRYRNYLKEKYECEIETNNIIIIRNFFNTLASSIKAWSGQRWWPTLHNFWNDYATYAFDQYNQKKAEIIIYDLWLEKEYRDLYSQKLNFTNLEIGIVGIPHYGGGSSFKEKEVNRDNLKNRWKMMLKNDEFVNIAKNFKHWDNYIKLFGMDEAYHFFYNGESNA